MNIRLSAIHAELLELTVIRLKMEGAKTNKTDVIEKALHDFCREVLGSEMTMKVIDKHFTQMD